MIATAATAQQYCGARGCAVLYSEDNLRVSKCCASQPRGDFNECCRLSCNIGTPCR
ncbi:PcF and SCR74-like cys-rich secreted peptide [Phytophthora megakarya]|uniref:PcF and SCR74-like cys-rich secreted peptide n=1 Tax=Phytophthora megakarya TaxID=4795 RepID=A0A225UEM2_9STRA|nr:PcF and SCR74-like cys-rich secreted peptide [Phytophthora megakarya]